MNQHKNHLFNSKKTFSNLSFSRVKLEFTKSTSAPSMVKFVNWLREPYCTAQRAINGWILFINCSLQEK